MRSILNSQGRGQQAGESNLKLGTLRMLCVTSGSRVHVGVEVDGNTVPYCVRRMPRNPDLLKHKIRNVGNKCGTFEEVTCKKCIKYKTPPPEVLLDDDKRTELLNLNCTFKTQRLKGRVYASILHGSGKLQSLQRFVTEYVGKHPVKFLNGNSLDCRRANLRIAVLDKELQRQKKNEYDKNRYHNNPAVKQGVKKRAAAWNKENSNIVYATVKKNREKRIQTDPEWAIERKRKLNETAKRLKRTSPSFKIACNLRKTLAGALGGRRKFVSAVSDVGCSVDELKRFLEQKFYSRANGDLMTWSNYGSEWHVDHRVPLSGFDLTKRDQQLEATHYTNLQPLWKEHNLMKGSKLNYFFFHLAKNFPSAAPR